MPFAGRKHHGDCRFGGTIANRTCLCRGAACRSRHNAADTNRLPLKWYAPIVSVRFFGSRYGTAVPSRDCTPRALPRASRSGRHVGLWPPRNDKPLVFAILMPARTCRRCPTGRRGRRPLQRPTDSLARLFPLHLLHSSSPNIAKNTPIRSDGGVFCYIGGRGVKQVEREKPCEAVCWAL